MLYIKTHAKKQLNHLLVFRFWVSQVLSVSTHIAFLIPSILIKGQSSKMADEQKPTAENMTMLQGFEWYVPSDQKHWVRLEKNVAELKKWGVDNVWIPPA